MKQKYIPECRLEEKNASESSGKFEIICVGLIVGLIVVGLLNGP